MKNPLQGCFTISCSTCGWDVPGSIADGAVLRQDSQTERNRYESLDGMRGLCAVMVAFFHFDLLLGTGVLARHGWLGVDMFFVLSGFVIALKYEDRLQSENGFRAFMRARAARLLPVQILGTMAVAVSLLMLYLSGHLNSPGVSPASLATAFLYGALLLPISLSPVANVAFGWGPPFPANPPLWSLQAEWVVNVLYARWFSPVRARPLILVWAVLVSGLVTYVFLGRRSWDLARPLEMFPCMARAAIGFLAGVLLCRSHRRGLLDWLPSLSPRIIFGVWFLVCWVPDAVRMPIFESAAAVIGTPLSVALLIRGERPLPKLYTALGALSYPLYASHFAIINLAKIWLAPEVGHSLLFLLPMLIAALLLAWGIERLAARVSQGIYRRDGAVAPFGKVAGLSNS